MCREQTVYGEGGEALRDEVWGGSGDTEFVTLLANAKIPNLGNSLVVQWLGLHAFTAEGLDSIPGLGTKIPQVHCAAEKTKANGTGVTVSILQRALL